MNGAVTATSTATPTRPASKAVRADSSTMLVRSTRGRHPTAGPAGTLISSSKGCSRGPLLGSRLLALARPVDGGHDLLACPLEIGVARRLVVRGEAPGRLRGGKTDHE